MYECPVKVTLPFKSIFPMKVFLDIAWPFSTSYKGRVFYLGNKEGTEESSGKPSILYRVGEESDADYAEIWVDCDGSVVEHFGRFPSRAKE